MSTIAKNPDLLWRPKTGYVEPEKENEKKGRTEKVISFIEAEKIVDEMKAKTLMRSYIEFGNRWL